MGTHFGFWELIDESRERSNGTLGQQTEILTTMLATCRPADIETFQEQFHQCYETLFCWDIWAAAHIVNGGCGDDTFMDFRAGVIAMGQDVFDAACGNAEALVDAFEKRPADDWFEEGFLYAAADAYEKVTGKPLPSRTGNSPSEPTGVVWDEHDLPTRFPRLWAVFESQDVPDTTQQHDEAQPPSKRPWWKFWK